MTESRVSNSPSRSVSLRLMLPLALLIVVVTGCAGTVDSASDAAAPEEAVGHEEPGGADHESGAKEEAGHVVEGPGGSLLREVAADDAPGVSLEVIADSKSGWNIHIETSDFTWTPEQAGGEARANGGHAHLYVDGEKVARLYGPWYHLDAAFVSSDGVEVTATLNANDHTTWAVAGEPVSASDRVDMSQIEGRTEFSETQPHSH